MNTTVKMFFSLRRLPPEFADVERLTVRTAMVAIVILAPIFFPGRHYFLYPLVGMLITYTGRLVGFVLHYRAVGKPSRPGPPSHSYTIAILLTAGTVALLAVTLYAALTTSDRFFIMQAYYATVLVTYCIGRYWAPKTMGVLDVLLVVGALVLYFHFLLAGYLAAAALAGLFAWHFLFRKPRRAVSVNISQPVKS